MRGNAQEFSHILPTASTFTRPDARLIAAAVTGEREALNALAEVLRPMVLRYCVSRLGVQETGCAGAEDCTQEVLVAVLVALPRYRYRTDRFLSFVFGVAAHKISDLLRRRGRERCEPLPDPDAVVAPEPVPPEDAVERLDQQRQLRRMLQRLPDNYREVLGMRVLFGFTAEETASKLNMPSAAAVRVTQFRALTKLRRSAPAAPPREGALLGAR
ncbi:sigma-70 family RNA polymerase sigma factor [Amycolatopsis sp. NPDC059027]|uniref:sigma-70 family RNA polymerase sigma factor n=1 Tax=unclassified Amycolatopsis TaxID=2618356 RepID=UPI00366DE701